MAVVPTLAAMAALTLFQHPEAQPEDVSVDYSAFSAPARALQQAWRRLTKFRRRLGWARMDMAWTAVDWSDFHGYLYYYGPGYNARANSLARYHVYQ